MNCTPTYLHRLSPQRIETSHIFSIDGLYKNTLQWQLNHQCNNAVIRRVKNDNGSEDSPYIACQLRWLSVENGAGGPGAGSASTDFACRST